METLLNALPLVSGFALGALLTWLAVGLHHQRQLLRLDHEMTAELETTLSKYRVLKARVLRVFEALGAKEVEVNRRLNVQRLNINSLQDRLLRHDPEAGRAFEGQAEDSSLVEPVYPDTFEAISTALAQDDLVELPADSEQLGSLFDELDRRTEEISQEQLQVIEQQSQSIADLTARNQELEPLAESLHQRELELETWRRLHQELAATNGKQIELLEKCIGEFQPLTQGLEGQEALVAQWRCKLEKVEAEADQYAAELVAEIEELESRTTVQEESLEGVRAELELAREAGQALQEAHQVLSDEFEVARAERDERDSTIEELRMSLATTKLEDESEIKALGEQLGNLEMAAQRVPELEAELSAVEASLEEADSRTQKLEADVHNMTQGLEAAAKELGSARRDLSELEADLAETRKELEDELARARADLAQGQQEAEQQRARFEAQAEELQRQVDASAAKLAEQAAELDRSSEDRDQLQEILEQVEQAKTELETELAHASEEVANREQQIEDLQSSLDDISGEASSQRAAVLAKISTFQEAHTMIEAMRPMLEGLESTLRQGEDPSLIE